jgi:hypothetical protein
MKAIVFHELLVYLRMKILVTIITVFVESSLLHYFAFKINELPKITELQETGLKFQMYGCLTPL